LQVSHQGSESSFKCSTAFKASFQKKTRGKRALASQLCRVRERASKHWQERREQRCWERVTERKLHDTSTTALAGKTQSKVEKLFKGPLKRQDEAFKGLSNNTRFQGIWKHLYTHTHTHTHTHICTCSSSLVVFVEKYSKNGFLCE
jgi:hypothetical protein